MQNLDEADPVEIDLRELVIKLGTSCKCEVEVGPDAVQLPVASDLLEFALSALLDNLSENQTGRGNPGLTIQLRSTGSHDELTALISVKGRNLELEGILPEPVIGDVPNQGRMAVFLAKEIIRLHQGEIHAGPGLQGTEILISLRAC
jgi:hypothetical protein|uniref:hypothetical protein n=1 Tax=Cephaloticoccus sp. TaxID=1985742 RepID=UPI0040499AF6